MRTLYNVLCMAVYICINLNLGIIIFFLFKAHLLAQFNGTVDEVYDGSRDLATVSDQDG